MNFFTYYTEIVSMSLPFETFRGYHFIILLGCFTLITVLLKYYRGLHHEQQKRFQNYMAIYFLSEEIIYLIWLLLNCHEHVWQELLPLQLCSFCVYVAIAAVYSKRSELQFFSAIIGTLAGFVAIIYPANLSELYPVFSYRTINFFFLHSAFILFGFIQLQNSSLLQYRNVKRCSCLLGSMVILAFLVNLRFHTNYMFLGVPSTIPFIRYLYSLTGIFFFIPVVILLLMVIQYTAIFFFRGCNSFMKQFR